MAAPDSHDPREFVSDVCVPAEASNLPDDVARRTLLIFLFYFIFIFIFLFCCLRRFFRCFSNDDLSFSLSFSVCVLMIHRHARASNSQSQNDERFFFPFLYLLLVVVHLFFPYLSCSFTFSCSCFVLRANIWNESALASHVFVYSHARSVYFFFFSFFFFFFFSVSSTKQQQDTLLYCNDWVAMVRSTIRLQLMRIIAI